MKPSDSNNKGKSSGWEYAGLGFEFTGMFLACTALGWWIDDVQGAGKQWFMLGGMFLGLGAGLYHILLRTSQIEENDQQFEKKSASRSEDTTKKLNRLESEVEDVGNRIDQFIKEESARNKKNNNNT